MEQQFIFTMTLFKVIGGVAVTAVLYKAVTTWDRGREQVDNIVDAYDDGEEHEFNVEIEKKED